MSRYKQGLDQRQGYLLPESLDEAVSAESPARLVKVFVESLPESVLQPALCRGASPHGGQPAYDPRLLLSCWIYAYTHRITSSRALSRQVELNIELKWLCGNLRPSYKTLCDFRMANGALFEGALRRFSGMCVEHSVLGGEGSVLAVDGTTLRSRTSRKTLRRLREGQKQEAREVGAYIRRVKRNDEGDGDAPGARRLSFGGDAESFRALLESRGDDDGGNDDSDGGNYGGNDDNSNDSSGGDDDARLMRVGEGRLAAGYNGQAVVDVSTKLIVATDVTRDANDSHQLHAMGLRAREALGAGEVSLLADKGYCTAGELAKCERDGITPYVSPRRQTVKGNGYPADMFRWDGERGGYECPAGRHLPLVKQGRTFGKPTGIYRARRSDCGGCPRKSECTPDHPVRTLDRVADADALSRNRERMSGGVGERMMDLRKGSVEQAFSWMKAASFNTHHLMLRGLKKVRGEFALLGIGYNLKRMTNMVGHGEFIRMCASSKRMAAA